LGELRSWVRSIRGLPALIGEPAPADELLAFLDAPRVVPVSVAWAHRSEGGSCGASRSNRAPPAS